MNIFCLVKLHSIFDDEDSASEAARIDLDRAYTVGDGSPKKFALSLRGDGYVSLPNYRVIRDH